MTSRGCLNLTSRDVPGTLIWDVPRTLSGRPLEDLESTQTWMSNFFITFLSELIRLTKSISISTLKMYWELSKTSKMEHFLQNQLITFKSLTIFVKELYCRSSTGFLIPLSYCLVMLFGMLTGWLPKPRFQSLVDVSYVLYVKEE